MFVTEFINKNDHISTNQYCSLLRNNLSALLLPLHISMQMNKTSLLSNIVSHFLCHPAVYAVYKHYCALRVGAKCGRTQRPRVICLTLKGSLVCVRFAGSYATADQLARSPKWVAANRAWAMHVGREEKDNPTRDCTTVFI